MRLRNFQAQERGSGATVHKILGRSDPLVTRDRSRIYESGALTILSDGEEDRADIDALLDSGSVLLLQFPAAADEPDRYISPIGVHTRERVVDKSWVHLRAETISWQQVDEPTGNIEEWPA